MKVVTTFAVVYTAFLTNYILDRHPKLARIANWLLTFMTVMLMSTVVFSAIVSRAVIAVD